MGSTIALLEVRLPALRERRRRLEDELAAVIAQESAMVSVLEGLAALAGALIDGSDEQHDEPVGAAHAADPTEPPAADTATGRELAPVGVPADGPEASRPEPAPAKPTRRRSTSATRTTARTARKAPAGKAAPVEKTVPAEKSVPATVPAPEQDAVAEAPAAPARRTVARRAAGSGAGKAAAGKAATKTVPSPRKAPAATPSGRRRLTDTESVLAVLAQADAPLRAREVTTLLGLDEADGTVNAVRTRLERLAKAGRAQRPGRGLYTAAAG
ncbi:hypothetical protein OG871_32855 [Kitasatospora sp. NBC_00374]|uniref:hypothetical protein n=1 Tax=Kitasatospora sp. NBC_00374 TaxID=2975964 RepID=UPI0032522B2A